MARGEAVIGRLIAGIGFRPGTSEADLRACLEQALTIAGLQDETVARFATLAARATEPAILALAGDAELIFVPDEALRGFEASCATRSTRVASLYGVGSVAEAAALAAAGPGGALVLPRIATARVTCALARTCAPTRSPP